MGIYKPCRGTALMGRLIKMGSCPFCEKGQNTSCFATYDDGYHCYSCGKHKSGDKDLYAFRNNVFKEIKINIPTIVQSPCEFSPRVLQWLYKYYVFENLIKKYNIGYVPKSDFKDESLMFGVYEENKLAFWQQRFFPNKSFITGGNKNTLFYINSFANSNRIVLVEDYISAIRIGEFENVLCLWGVHVNYNMSKLLEELDMNVLIWLDPDEAGQTASKELLLKLTRNLESYAKFRAFAVQEPKSVCILSTDKQPKDYCDTELQHYLENNKNESI